MENLSTFGVNKRRFMILNKVKINFYDYAIDEQIFLLLSQKQPKTVNQVPKSWSICLCEEV